MKAITLQPPILGGQLLEHVYRIANWDRQIAISFADGNEHVYP